MTWKNYFSTSIGKKLQMGLTGLFLILFLIVHCYINAQIFWNDGGEKFTEAAHFMGTNFVIRTIEIGLFAFLILHIVQGLMLWVKNSSRRNNRYAIKAGRPAPGTAVRWDCWGRLVFSFLSYTSTISGDPTACRRQWVKASLTCIT